MSNHSGDSSGDEGDLTDGALGSRKRSEAISARDRMLLLELVATHKSVIESKKTDFGTIRKKQNAWNLIESQFNSQGAVKKSAKQLKKTWENLKRKGKTEVTQQKRRVRKTGGGPCQSGLSAESNLVAAIVPAQMNSLENPYDCDNDTSDAMNGNGIMDDEPTTAEDPTAIKESVVLQPDKKKRDPRSALVDFEYEEHKIRLRTLVIKYESEVKKKQMIHRQAEMMEIEHKKKLELYDLQISSAGYIGTISTVAEEMNE